MPNVKVRITSESEEQQAGNAELLQTEKTPEVARMATTSLFVHAAASNVRQAVQFGISNVGNYTGDYVLQRNINRALDIVGSVSSIAMGAITGGWVGAIIATSSVAFKYGMQEISRNLEYQNQEINSSLQRQRSGNELTNGSRGTEN